MTKVLLITQDKGGVGKSLATRGLAEVVPGAPVIEVDASPRLIELGKRAKFFKTRADREDIESTGGAASRSEFDPIIDAIASATLPTVVDIGANTGVALLTVIGDVAEDFAAAGIEFGSEQRWSWERHGDSNVKAWAYAAGAAGKPQPKRSGRPLRNSVKRAAQ